MILTHEAVVGEFEELFDGLAIVGKIDQRQRMGARFFVGGGDAGIGVGELGRTLEQFDQRECLDRIERLQAIRAAISPENGA
jgi:hypothetical protein